MKILEHLLAVAMLSLLASCTPYDRVTSEMAVSEVSGLYRLSKLHFDGPTNAEIRSKAADAYIELRADGTAEVHKLPNVSALSSNQFVVSEYRGATVPFEVSAMGGSSRNTFYGIYLRFGKVAMETPKLRRSGTTLHLSFEYFDGDFVERMRFTREN